MAWQWLEAAITNEESSIRGIGIFVELYVGDSKMDDILDIAVFFQAIKDGGRYPLFTCICGCFGCGGYYVDIECTDDAWIMKNKFHPHNKEVLVEEFEYHFPWARVYMVATQIKDHLLRIIEKHPRTLLATGESGVFEVGDILKAKHYIALREGTSTNQTWFENYYALIENEAKYQGKVFHWHSEESGSVVWPEKELEMCDASGWLIAPEEVEDFERCYERYYKGEGWGAEEFSRKYFHRIRSVDWSMKKDGTIVIKFGPEEGE